MNSNARVDPKNNREQIYDRGRPKVDPTATVTDCLLGRWTRVGPWTQMMETRLGDYSYLMEQCQVIYATIGKFCSIASQVRINPPNHPIWRASSHHFTYRSELYDLGENEEGLFQWRRNQWVVIGHDVWIGHGAIILPGTTVGTGAVIGAGSVVTKDVPPYTIVAGNPAKPIRRRVSEAVEASLMKIQWWHWPHDRISEALDDFRRLDALSFCQKYLPPAAGIEPKGEETPLASAASSEDRNGDGKPNRGKEHDDRSEH